MLPLTFKNADDYDRINEGDALEISGIYKAFESGIATLTDKTTGESFASKPFPEFIKNIMANGGLVGYTESEMKD